MYNLSKQIEIRPPWLVDLFNECKRHRLRVIYWYGECYSVHIMGQGEWMWSPPMPSVN